MKKSLIAIIAAAALAGCATGPYGETYVTPAGAAAGGAVVGGALGYAIGANQSRPVYVQPRPYYNYAPHYYGARPYYSPRPTYGYRPYPRRGW